MAVAAKDIPITREMVYNWLVEADKTNQSPVFYIKQKINDLNLPDRMVDVSQRSDYSEDEVDIEVLITDDLDSYVLPDDGS
jgi:hypothetical protein